MAKFQSPLLGYNNNVRHKNRVFHIQTEDSGVNHPHIITHLFMDGGRILKSVKTSYAEHVGADGMNEIVRGLMKEQHKAMFIALRDGQFDHIVDPKAAAAAAKVSAEAAAKADANANANADANADADADADADANANADANGDADAKAADAAAVEGSASEVAPAVEGVVEVAAAGAGAEAEAERAHGEPPTNPEPPRIDVELSPNTIDDSRRRSASNHPAPLESSRAAAVSARVGLRAEDAPMTTRQPPEARPQHTPSGRELTLDFDALERAAQDAIVGPAASLFHSNDLPPPPKNMFASKEPGTGGAYRAVEADPRRDARADSREEPAPRSSRGDSRADPQPRPVPRSDPREEAAPRSSRGQAPASSAAAVAAAAAAANNARNEKQPIRPSTRAPASRPSGDARYAPARPAAIFGSTQRPPPASLFSDELVSDKSLDEVILSYLAEDLEPPRRK